MFKAATRGPRKVITANRLDDGLVVFLGEAGDWALAIAEARLLEDGPDLEAAVAYGQAQQEARIVIDPYPIDVEVGDHGPVPVRLREKIRADRGPTVVYGDAERAKLTVAPRV